MIGRWLAGRWRLRLERAGQARFVLGVSAYHSESCSQKRVNALPASEPW
jgi:hypothetical protein